MFRKTFSWSGHVALGVLLLVGCNQSQQPTKADQRKSQTAEEKKPKAEVQREFKAPEPFAGMTPPSERPQQAWRRNAEGKKRRLNRQFLQHLRASTSLQTLQANQTVTIPVQVKNIGRESWWPPTTAPAGVLPVNLSYHWLERDTQGSQTGGNNVSAPTGFGDGEAEKEKKGLRFPLARSTATLKESGKVVVLEGIRTSLPHELPPGGSVTVNATIQAPAQAGNFILRLTMVREGDDWLENLGARPLDIPVTVTAQ